MLVAIAMNTVWAALSLCDDLALPSVRRHLLRSLLTLVGVVIGTQVVVATALLNRSTLAAFEHTVETIAGRADLQVSNGSAGVPEDLVDMLARMDGVANASALIEGMLTTDSGDLTVFGVDLLGDQGIRETQFPRRYVHIADGLAFANATDSIAIAKTYAKRAHVSVGSTLTVRGPNGTDTLTVRGILDPVGPAALFGGNVGLVDLPTAQRLFNRAGDVDQIDIAVTDKQNVPLLLPHLQALVAGSGVVEPPRNRGAHLGSMLAGAQTVLTLVSVFAVVVGGFIIYHTMETAIAHRRHDFALVRALGYRRRALLLAIALEALAYGTIGTAIGTTLGIVAARGSLALATPGVGAIWGHIEASGIAVSGYDFLTVGILGIGSALVASLAPALEAARLRVVDQLHGSATPFGNNSWPWGPAAKGAAFAIVGYTLLALDIRLEGFALRIAFILAGVLLIALGFGIGAPILVHVVVRLVRRLMRATQPASLSLATENVLGASMKSRAALAALMVAFALVLIVGAFVRSLQGSITSWIEQTFSADLRVSPSLQLPLPAGPTLTGTLEPEIRAIPQVMDVETSRMINVQIGDHVVILRTEIGRGGREPSPVIAGDVDAASPAFARGEVVFVSDNFAYREHKHIGDKITLDTPSGSKAFTIAAVVTDYTLDVGTIIIARDVYRRLWKDDLVNDFLVWLAPGSNIEEVRAALSARLRPRFSVIVSTGREFSGQIERALDQAFLLTYAIQVVAIAIAVIGVVNFFVADILDRRREIGLLRSTALSRRQLVRMFAGEALLLGSVGGMMAVLFAWPVSRLLITQSTRMVSGWRLIFEFPTMMAIVTIVTAALTAVVAASQPARRIADAPIHDLVILE